MKYPVSKSDYETFRNVTEVLVEQFQQHPREHNRFYEAAVKRFGEGADETHAFALFVQEVYSFRYISVITGYAKRNGLAWRNSYIREIQCFGMLVERIRERGRCDPEFTHLFFAKTDAASLRVKPFATIPILECTEKDGQIEIGIVERKKIETSLDMLMSYKQTHPVSDPSLSAV
jgi:hypothetical protein